jgi:hypothetical protein
MNSRKTPARRVKKKRQEIHLGPDFPLQFLGQLIQGLWKAILMSDLPSRDKAEILRLVTFAVTFIVVTAIFVMYSR